MARKFFLISALAIAGVFASVSASAQAPPQAGPGGPPPAPKQNIDLATATKMVAAAEAAASLPTRTLLSRLWMPMAS
jgi:hypothetical protein